MLSRVARIPLRFTYSAALKPEISNVPTVVRQVKRQLEESTRLRQEITSSNYPQYAINFQDEIDGKRLILLALPQVRSKFNLSDISTALFSVGAAYGVVSNFNYVLTLAFAVGALATSFSSGRLNVARTQKIIASIEIDRNQRLHILYMTKDGYDCLIVDKKDFTYNLLAPGALGSNAIWCKANNESFWISRRTLKVNNHQLHHLL